MSLIQKLKSIAKELPHAQCYFSTGEIVGCQKGSFVYWHEYTHYLQSKNSLLNQLMSSQTVGISLVFFWLINNWFLVLLWPILFLSLEIHAWIYSFYKLFQGEVIWRD